MYGRLRARLDPSIPETSFAIPAEYTELRKQLAPIPLEYDDEGRMKLPPKGRPLRIQEGAVTKVTTLTELIGHSPDEADAVALAVQGMEAPPQTAIVSAVV